MLKAFCSLQDNKASSDVEAETAGEVIELIALGRRVQKKKKKRLMSVFCRLLVLVELLQVLRRSA